MALPASSFDASSASVELDREPPAPAPDLSLPSLCHSCSGSQCLQVSQDLQHACAFQAQSSLVQYDQIVDKGTYVVLASTRHVSHHPKVASSMRCNRLATPYLTAIILVGHQDPPARMSRAATSQCKANSNSAADAGLVAPASNKVCKSS